MRRLRPAAVRAMGQAFASAGLDAREGEAAARAVAFVVGITPASAVAGWHAPILAAAGRRGVHGITLGPAVYLAHPRGLDHWPLLVHETAHVRQFLARGTARFLVGYGVEYLARLALGAGLLRAYLDLADEQEARRVEGAGRRLGPPPAPWFVDPPRP